jgi:RimJ/RimL family protein N-acetyltransferase
MNLINELKKNPKDIINNGKISIRVLSNNSDGNIFFQDVANITVWRNFFPDAYITSFYSTWNRTYDWLKGVYMSSNSDIFLMIENNKICFGHMAFINFTRSNDVVTCELTRVVRGPGLGESTEIYTALDMALRWCHKSLGVNEVNLRVFRDNTSAISLYKNLGFVETGLRHMYRQQDGQDSYEWHLCNKRDSERELMLMKKVLSTSNI